MSTFHAIAGLLLAAQLVVVAVLIMGIAIDRVQAWRRRRAVDKLIADVRRSDYYGSEF